MGGFEQEETDRILAEEDNIIVESQARPMLEILGAGIYPTYDAAGGAKGMARREGSGVSGEGLCQEPPVGAKSPLIRF